jgi:hypothetical protein
LGAALDIYKRAEEQPEGSKIGLSHPSLPPYARGGGSARAKMTRLGPDAVDFPTAHTPNV